MEGLAAAGMTIGRTRQKKAYSYSQVERLEGSDAEQYASPEENAFQTPAVEPESTDSIDVDTASYANVRRVLQNNQVPPPGAVRIEEMVNYFSYDYPEPKRDQPFAVDMEAAGCPWNGNNRLVRVGLKAREVDAAQRGPSNLVFLLDVSVDGDIISCRWSRRAAMLVDQLTEDDHVSIAYAGQAAGARADGRDPAEADSRADRGPPGRRVDPDRRHPDGLRSALANFVPGKQPRDPLHRRRSERGRHRRRQLVGLIKEQASSGVFLTVVGFGTGNLKTPSWKSWPTTATGPTPRGWPPRRKVFVEQVSGRLVTVAQDVKIQIEFNPAEVAGYRLLGYENACSPRRISATT